MKRTDFTMLLDDSSGEGTWSEDISCVLDPGESVMDRAQRIIADYNAYLAPYEHERKVLSVRILKEPKPGMFLKHNWRKATFQDDSYKDDKLEHMVCYQCGCTGIKRKANFTVVDRQFIQYEFHCPNKKV